MDDQSSVVAHFQFSSYKVHSFNLKCNPYIDFFLNNLKNIPNPWQFDIIILQPRYSNRNKHYICGLALNGKIQDQTNQSILLDLSTEISGIFKVKEKIYSNGLEEKLVKIQGPSLLLPYLRGTISSYLANAGLGVFIFPLINIQQMAENSTANTEIKVLD